MSAQEEIIVGKCLQMCPKKERILRENEGLLHKFEYDTNSFMDASTEDQMAKTRRALELAEQSGAGSAGYGGNYRNRNNPTSHRTSWHRSMKSRPKADINKIVKSFARSAAGQDKTLPEDLRPPKVLEETVAYLYKEILMKTNEPYIVIYDFVFDRLRSVRQDLVIQRIADRTAIKILESIVRFHVFSGFVLRNESPSVYDSHINEKHLMDCLRTLLGLYELNEYKERSRVEFEALQVLLNPESITILSRALSLDQWIRDCEEFKCAVKMSLAYQFKNYVAYFRLSKRLRPLLASCIGQYTRRMRSNAYRSMSLAYGVKTCKVPLLDLVSILDYPSMGLLEVDLGCCSINLFAEDSSADRFARFDKNCASIPITEMRNLTCEFGDANSGCNVMDSSVCLYTND